MSKVDGQAIYEKIKKGRTKFDEVIHCPMIINLMANDLKGTMSAFCCEALISDRTFYTWLKENEIFQECYALGKMFAREHWEEEGRKIRDERLMPGESSYAFEYWRMIGWSRFGIGKNSRIRLDLNPHATPNEHYSQLLKQASEGEFTAGEIKQLMEAVNVGLNTHQVFELQKEIDQLRKDLATMSENTNGDNPFSDKGTAKKDQDTVADSLCIPQD